MPYWDKRRALVEAAGLAEEFIKARAAGTVLAPVFTFGHYGVWPLNGPAHAMAQQLSRLGFVSGDAFSAGVQCVARHIQEQGLPVTFQIVQSYPKGKRSPRLREFHYQPALAFDEVGVRHPPKPYQKQYIRLGG